MGQPKLTVVVLAAVTVPRLAWAQGIPNPSSTSAPTSQASQLSSGVSLVILVGGVLGGVGGGITTTVNQNKARAEAAARKAEPVAPADPAGPPPLPLPLAPEEPSAPPLPPPGVLRETGPSFDAMLLAWVWLRANQLQLKQDLALGAGPPLQDLAAFASIAPAHRVHFGQLLRRHQGRLRTPHDPTPLQAAELLSLVGELASADPLLRADAGLAAL